MIKAGIIGYGKSGKNIHAPLIDACDGIVLKSVVTRSGPEQLPGRPEVKVVRTAENLILDRDIDLVVITTPNHLHYEMAQSALNAGKHVVVDKPFTVTFSEARELEKLAGKTGRLLTVFQNRRWDGDFLTVKQLLNTNVVGRLTEFESYFNRFRSRLKENAWKEMDLPGSGILYDLGPHLIDQAVQLFGKPDKLYADVRHQRGGDADDYFELHLHYNDFSACLKAGMLVADPTPRFVLRGDQGAYVKYGFDPQEQDLSEGKDPHSPDWGREPEERHGVLRIENGERLLKRVIKTAAGEYPVFYRNVSDAIEGKTGVYVKPGESAEVIRLIELAIKSSRKGRILEC